MATYISSKQYTLFVTSCIHLIRDKYGLLSKMRGTTDSHNYILSEQN